jgi:hypothetical protein
LGADSWADYFLFHKGILKKGTKMRKIILFLIPCIFVSISGCAPLIIGGAVGALGGYAVSKDTLQGETDKNYDGLWEAALTVSRIRGQIKYEDKTKGYIELEAESSKVYIRLVRLTASTTRLKVSARKYHFPNMGLAQDIFVKIMEQAR